MPGHGPVGGLGRAVADHDHVGDAARVRLRPRGRRAARPVRRQRASSRRSSRGPARTAPGRSSRGSPTSWDRRGTRYASGGDLLGDHHSSSQAVTWAASRGHTSFGSFGRRARSLARSWARHARYPARPPLAATSRLTVDVARPNRDAIALKVSPRCTPRLISSRSATLRRPSAGSHADLAHRPPLPPQYQPRRLMRTRHLPRHLSQRQALSREPAHHPPLLHRQAHPRHPQPPGSPTTQSSAHRDVAGPPVNPPSQASTGARQRGPRARTRIWL